MEAPKNHEELKTALGMVTYLAKFAPNFSEVTAPMQELLKQKNEFLWEAPQEAAFQCTKDLLTREPGPILAYFDEKKDVFLEVDASQHGLGASLLQDGRPVAYASKSLTPTEQQYAQIEKEMYGIACGYEHFHQFLCGRPVTVYSDHKPVESITKKLLCAAPAKVRRMMLKLQKYDVTVVPSSRQGHSLGRHTI